MKIIIDGTEGTLETLFQALYPDNPNNWKAIKILSDSFKRVEVEARLDEIMLLPRVESEVFEHQEDRISELQRRKEGS